jgi:hypothetical protein
MILVDNETIAAVHQGFQAHGKAAAAAELRRRFWLLDSAVDSTLERILTCSPIFHRLPVTSVERKH